MNTNHLNELNDLILKDQYIGIYIYLNSKLYNIYLILFIYIFN